MAENLVFCIARQFGSGGREVGLRLAEALNIPFYDKELLKAAADKSGIGQEFFEKNDERPVGGLLRVPQPAEGEAGAKAQSYADYVGYVQNDRVQAILTEVIREVAAASSCVIIGRCADYVLRGRPGMLSVFLHAGAERRVQRIARLHNLPEDEAHDLIRKTDCSRANYYSHHTGRDWGGAANYDISMDVGRLGTDKTVELLRRSAELFAPKG